MWPFIIARWVVSNFSQFEQHAICLIVTPYVCRFSLLDNCYFPVSEGAGEACRRWWNRRRRESLTNIFQLHGWNHQLGNDLTIRSGTNWHRILFIKSRLVGGGLKSCCITDKAGMPEFENFPKHSNFAVISMSKKQPEHVERPATWQFCWWPFWDGENVTLSDGCWWPPTIGDKKVTTWITW